MTDARRAKEIIEKIQYITLATIDESGNPWNAPVFAAYDSKYNFYFGTDRESQKAKNIRANKNVFLVLYDSIAPSGKGEGVYIKASAAELTDSREIAVAHKLLSDRHVVPYWKLEEVQADAPIRLYKVVPEKVWINGEGRRGEHYIDTRIEAILTN